MSVEIVFPTEFCVPGTPVSLQAKRADSRRAWKDRVRHASQASLPEGHFSTRSPISITLFYFPAAKMLDNPVKPILDALCQHIYFDDRQVVRVWVEKFEPDKVFQFSSPSPILTHAIEADKPLVYVRVSDNPTEDLV